jgi:uncharacterized protein (DUF362 family)/ferredoxin
MQKQAVRPTVPALQDVVTLHSDEDVAATARRAIDLLGGMAAVLNGRRVAVLKPNFVAGRPARTGATTTFALLAAVAELVHAAGATPLLYETPGTEFDRDATFTILGVEAFCRQHGITLIRDVDRWVELRPVGARRLRRFHVPGLLTDACLINLPVLKSHVVSGMSVAMKNLMGILPLEDRRSMHTLGIQQSIVDLNMGVHSDLILVDGTVGQEGDGPLYGQAANLGVLVAGRDALAVDLVSCRLVNVDPQSIGHLRLGQEQLGPRRPRVLGESIAPRQTFAVPKVPPLYRFVFWLMYPLDYPYHRVTGEHLCTSLYHTGIVGTRPRILEDACTRCGVCVETCPLPKVIDLKTLRIDPHTCERCLLCYEACPEGAIAVKGMSGAQAPKQSATEHMGTTAQ